MKKFQEIRDQSENAIIKTHTIIAEGKIYPQY